MQINLSFCVIFLCFCAFGAAGRGIGNGDGYVFVNYGLAACKVLKSSALT